MASKTSKFQTLARRTNVKTGPLVYQENVIILANVLVNLADDFVNGDAHLICAKMVENVSSTKEEYTDAFAPKGG